MNQKPTLMNKEWSDLLQKMDYIFDRLNKLEEKLDFNEGQISNLWDSMGILHERINDIGKKLSEE